MKRAREGCSSLPLNCPDRPWIVLVDMDGTIADFDARAFDLMATRHPEVPLPQWDERQYPLANSLQNAAHRQLLRALFKEPGFFSEMKPIEGAVVALREMVANGYEVRLCSSPLANSPRCVMEKVEWVIAHLGIEWVDRLILTRDKTLVRGDILIDDAPTAKGQALVPTWKHVYYDQVYNRPESGGSPSHGRLTAWSEWRRCAMVTRPVAIGLPTCFGVGDGGEVYDSDRTSTDR